MHFWTKASMIYKICLYPISFTIHQPRVDANERPCNPRRACKKYLNRLLSSDPATAADMYVRTYMRAGKVEFWHGGFYNAITELSIIR